MIIAGLDFSYTSPAICVWDTETEFKFENLHIFNTNEKKKLTGKYGNITLSLHPEYNTQEERFRNICSWASNVLTIMGVEEACIEGYSFGASSGRVFDIAENTSLIKQFMDINGIPFTVHPPAKVKLRFTGKGGAKKDEMVDRFDSLFGVNIHSIIGVNPVKRPKVAKPLDDLCDSTAVMMMHSIFDKKEN